jgi:hypothetical protein
MGPQKRKVEGIERCQGKQQQKHASPQRCDRIPPLPGFITHALKLTAIF